MTERHFEKCLKTDLRAGSVPCTYLLPYTGNLTAGKFTQLAERFAKRVAPLFPHTDEDSRLTQALEVRLRSEWLTGREKDVTVTQDTFGSYTLKGENWMMYGVPAQDFVIVE